MTDQERSLAEGWRVSRCGKWLKREYKFSNFKKALKLFNQAADICEELGHHADFEIGWGYCRIKTQTHDAGGIITEKDYELANKIESISCE